MIMYHIVEGRARPRIKSSALGGARLGAACPGFEVCAQTLQHVWPCSPSDLCLLGFG